MAERNPQVPHYIRSLLYVRRNENYCGYNPELITDNIGTEWRKLLICSECKGISRRARQEGANIVCEMCVTGPGGNFDENVENKVTSLNSECPLLVNGCDWRGKLGKIEEHMQRCPKVLVECQQKCGIVFEREGTAQHNKQVCLFRKKKCDYCQKELQANRENEHIKNCKYHPDTEVPCPYKELGCNVIVLRKNNDEHQTENIIDHQKLMLNNMNRQINRSQQTLDVQRNRIGNVEGELRWEIEGLATRTKKVRDEERMYYIMAMVAAALASLAAILSGVAIVVTLSNNIQSNSQLMETNSQQIQSLMIGLEYIKERDKELPGREWIDEINETSIVGPVFYLEQCKLELGAEVSSYDSVKKRIMTRFYVDRKEGDYDGVITNCTITYTYTTFGYVEDIKPTYTTSIGTDTNLKVGDSVNLMNLIWVESLKKLILRVYFDTEGA